MNVDKNHVKKTGALLAVPVPASAQANGHQLQIDVGNYEIFAGDTKMGEVWVEVDPDHPGDPSYTVEHWCLFSQYQSPSSALPSASLGFRYATGLHASLADFLRFVASVSGARYIKACCQEQAPA